MRRWFLAPAVVAAVAVVAVGLARRSPPAGTAAVLPPPAPTSAATTTAPPGTTAARAAETVPTTPPAAPGADPPRFPTTVAVAARADVRLHDAPAGREVAVLRSPAPFSRMPQVFVVQPGGDGTAPGWLHVGSRLRPNGSTGWIRAEDVTLDRNSWSIDINLTDRWATVYDGANVFAATPVVIGTDASPTPVGDYFIVEGVWTGAANGPYGPFVYGLSAHSDVYTEFGGGDGQIGLHGTNQPGLLGTAASHGCVRFPNDVMLRLARALPMGVPVHIH